MRVDVGIWTAKRLVTEPQTVTRYESHWLRFERFMGDKQYAGTSSTDGRFTLTDVDYLMQGNTFLKFKEFDFRAV